MATSGCSTEVVTYPMTARWQSLPDEILIIVFDYLKMYDLLVASLVCRRWEALVGRRALLVRRRTDQDRVHPRLRLLFVTARLTHLLYVSDTTRNLRKLVVHDRVPLGDQEIHALAERAPHLIHLDVFINVYRLNSLIYPLVSRLETFVVNETLAPSLLRELVAHSRLAQLHMYGRSFYYPTRLMVQLISSRRRYFTDLTLRCNELPEAGYLEISRCSELIVLRLYACWLLRELNAVRLMRLHKLRVLHLTGARMLRSKQLHMLIDMFPEVLVELVLSSTCFGDEHVPALAARLPHLLVLELWNTPASSDALCFLAKNLPELQEFDIDKVFDTEQLREMVAHPSLRRLRCSKPEEMANEEFQAAAGRLAPVVTPAARYGHYSLRAEGDGWRGILYYHWSTEHAPQPLPEDVPPPGFDNDFEDDYSLLGVEVGLSGDELHTTGCFQSSIYESKVKVKRFG